MLLFVLLLVFIGIAIAMAWFFISHDRGAKEPIAALWLAVGLGLGGAVVASALEGKLVDVENLAAGTPHATMLLTALSIGIIEEACKFVPLAFFIYKKRYFNEHTDGVIYFALAGLGFGLPENIMYTIQFGTKTAIIRLFLTPLFHAATTGIIGYFLVKRKLSGKSAWGVVVPLAIVAALHGFYNFGLSTGPGLYMTTALVITLGLSAGLFLLFLRATGRDQIMGLAAVGHNAFCRSCGRANPKHHLYCVGCGKNA